MSATRGPWRLERSKTGRYTVRGAAGERVEVLSLNVRDDDAKLIASAPALADELATLATAASEMRCRCSLEEIASGHHVDCGKPTLLERVDRALAVLALAGRLP